VRVENHAAGHAFPTGNATAPVVKLRVVARDEAGAVVFTDQREYKLVYVDADGEPVTDPTSAVRIGSDTTLQPLQPRHERFFLPHRLGARRVEAELVYQRWNDGIIDNHAGLAREFLGRYARQGFRVHRLLANLGSLDYARLDRIRNMAPTVVDRAEADLPGPPAVPAFLAAPPP
jgi:hypothetical protein